MSLRRRTDRGLPVFNTDDPDTESRWVPYNAIEQGLPAEALVPVEEPPPANEIIIETRTGRVRQAGADDTGAWLVAQRVKYEQSLYMFTKGVLKRKLLHPTLHKWFCDSLTKEIPPYRKLRLMPRGHLKSSIVSEAMPIHMHIQPATSNIYWPGEPGNELNIILCGEKKDLMAEHLRWVEGQWESNKLLRALWPHICWDNPRRQSRKWNEDEMILPRETDYADPSLRVIGVDGAITGAHCKVLIKDDLVSLAAANSQTVMHAAISWHRASRALLAPFEATGLEFTIGTRWAVADLYSDMMEHDMTIDAVTRSIIENGKAIWPEQFPPKVIEQLRRDHGVRFYLFYMNNASNPELVDFAKEELRWYTLRDGEFIQFEEDERDVTLAAKLHYTKPKDTGTDNKWRGRRFTPDVQREVFSGRVEYLRMKGK